VAEAIAVLAADLAAQARAAHHRLGLVFAGAPDWTFAAAQVALSAGIGERVAWLSERPGPGRPSPSGVAESRRGGPRWICRPVSRGSELLGTEVDVLVYDAHAFEGRGGLDPDSLGAALGALRGGGLFLLLAPDLAIWHRLPDPQAARVAVHPFAPDAIAGRFLRRFARCLTASDGILLLSHERWASAPERSLYGRGDRHARPSDAGPPPGPAGPPALAEPRWAAGAAGGCLTPDQAQAVAAILETARGRARRPLVITADRGRGKSSALGIAVAGLFGDGPRRILVTAPRRSAVAPLFRHAAERLPDAKIEPDGISQGQARLAFLPPDQACGTALPADLLLVDEAAGIPAPLLAQLLGRHPRVVFATTVHGYEGAGRGFEVRFRRTLDRSTPGWRELSMKTPIRWAPGDPLEAFAARALLLDAAPAADETVADAYPATCRCARLDRDALVGEGADANADPAGGGGGEALLSQLFGLLVLAHYQTRPTDLRQLLDGPNLRVYVLLHRHQVAATALVAVEGRIEPEIARAVFEGRRRPHGHLLPQTLCVHGGLTEATALGYARVIRIAVHPAAQGRGLGRLLLAGICTDAADQGLDCAGSSFGATGDLLGFWTRCGFVPVHLGTSRNAASGAHAMVVLHPLSPAGRSFERLAVRRLGERLPALLAEPLREVEPPIVACLLQAAEPRPWMPDPVARRELAAFAFALRPYEAALPALVRLAEARIGEALRLDRRAAGERDALIGKLLQRRDFGACARLAGLAGRAQVVALLRRAVGKLMGDCGPGVRDEA